MLLRPQDCVAQAQSRYVFFWPILLSGPSGSANWLRSKNSFPPFRTRKNNFVAGKPRKESGRYPRQVGVLKEVCAQKKFVFIVSWTLVVLESSAVEENPARLGSPRLDVNLRWAKSRESYRRIASENYSGRPRTTLGCSPPLDAQEP